MHLNYKVFGEGHPLIILHGLLGSLDNWQTIAKKLSENFKVYIIDQRNHGRSPHSDEFNYSLLAGDVEEFLREHHIAKTHLIGHSMGGKVAMQFALLHPDKLEKLIVVDTSPVAYDDRHSDVFEALFAANVSEASTREEVERTLREKLSKDETTVQFLMKGLQRAGHGANGFQWKFNVDALHKNYGNISAGIDAKQPFNNPTLFIKGERSSYISPENYSSIDKLFPHHQLTEIKDAGHWTHADKPEEFVAEVKRFLLA